jgi:cation:H+ antiporter
MWPELPFSYDLTAFLVAALVIGLGGTAMTSRVDMLADRTGVGEAMIGALLLGIVTSLSGTVTSAVAAGTGHPSLAFSNAIGGIAAQTAFLAIADVTYRRANLEHAAADSSNLVQAALLVLLLSIPLVAATTPEVTWYAIHPASVALVVFYLFGVHLARRARTNPMWLPSKTRETRSEVPEEDSFRISLPRLLIEFALLAVLVGGAGYVLAETGTEIAREARLSESMVGALFTAVTTSLPELVTTLAAVRRGALQLAVGGIIGGNTYDVLFLTISDAAYRDGSIYHAVGMRDLFWLTIALLMTAILLLGLLRREAFGFANIGFESALIFIVYGAAVVLQASLG